MEKNGVKADATTYNTIMYFFSGRKNNSGIMKTLMSMQNDGEF